MLEEGGVQGPGCTGGPFLRGGSRVEEKSDRRAAEVQRHAHSPRIVLAGLERVTSGLDRLPPRLTGESTLREYLDRRH